LVTNAVCHGDTPIWMRLSVGGGDLRVEVNIQVPRNGR